jgi:hypothetical protein
MNTNTLSSPPRDEQNPQTALRVRLATPPDPLLHAGGETAMSISKKRKEIFPLIALEDVRNALFWLFFYEFDSRVSKTKKSALKR